VGRAESVVTGQDPAARCLRGRGQLEREEIVEAGRVGDPYPQPVAGLDELEA
jgi:hypothetical protein